MNKILVKSRLCQAIFLLLLLTPVFSCKKKETVEVPVTKAIKGTFYTDVVETGDVQAIQSINISSPDISWRFGNLKIAQMVKDGAEVDEGDTLLVFDPSEVQKSIVEASSRLQMSYAELEKLKAQQQSSMEEQQANYESTRISYQISKIQFESAVYEAAIKRKEIQLNLDKANLALVRAKEQIENEKKIQAEDIKQKMISIEQDKTRLREANETLNRLYVVSPAHGIAIISRNWSTDNKFQLGDQCWSGFPIIQLPNLKKLKATVQINEVDISKIKMGQKVEIRPDAFSDSVYTGEVISVANLAVNKEGSTKIKVFPVDILIKDSGKKMLPGLSVSCRVLITRLDNVVSVPMEAVHTKGVEEYVFVKKGATYEKRGVQTGVSNTDRIVIIKGLGAGEVVAMADPFDLKDNTKKDKKESK